MKNTELLIQGLQVGGYINIYGLPSELQCYSYDYNKKRRLYTGLTNEALDETRKNSAILVMNNYDMFPTISQIELFAYRLYQADRTQDVNLNAQKTPIIIAVPEQQKMFMKNLYQQYNGNEPFIFGDKNQLTGNVLQVINTQAPYVIDKIRDYKREIWNEALTYLGINNIYEDKRERLITDEASQNNEVINLNLQAQFEPRKLAVKQMNELFKTNIQIKLRSDLNNILKSEETIIVEHKPDEEGEDVKNG